MAQITGPASVYAAYLAQSCSPDPAGQYVARQILALGQAIDARGSELTPAVLVNHPGGDQPEPASLDLDEDE